MKGNALSESFLKQARAEGRIGQELGVNMAALTPVPLPRVKRVKPVFPIVIDCPGLIVVSEMNQRGHWAKKLHRMAVQKDALLLAILLCRAVTPYIDKPIRIVFTRLGGRKMDSDNLAGAFKGVRDALCHWLGIDDGDDRLTFVYKQGKGVKGIRVEIEEL